MNDKTARAWRIQAESPVDQSEIHALHRAAFPNDVEARLVDSLRQRARPLVSLVAREGHELLGHIMFSPTVVEDNPQLLLLGLVPMAVHPADQGRGIGAALVRAGLERCAALGAAGVLVLGNPDFFLRFGFRPASRLGLRSIHEVPEDAFLGQWLVPPSPRVNARVHYPPTLADIEVRPR